MRGHTRRKIEQSCLDIQGFEIELQEKAGLEVLYM